MLCLYFSQHISVGSGKEREREREASFCSWFVGFQYIKLQINLINTHILNVMERKRIKCGTYNTKHDKIFKNPLRFQEAVQAYKNK